MMSSRSIENTKTQMRLAVVCGDGLPVSGLLTTLRNVIDLVRTTKGCPSIIQDPISMDLGYSWRADKAEFFPNGPRLSAYPAWMTVSSATPVLYDGYSNDLLQIRHQVATYHELDVQTKSDVRERIDKIALPYEQYFSKWFEDDQIDWVIAINMTLSDSVSVTQALHKAGERHWGNGRAGGIVFWDHDLFDSAAIIENGQRIYPATPNEFTPVPQDCPWHLWALASPFLARETEQYSTTLKPVVVPLVLPSFDAQNCDIRKDELIRDFLTEFNLLNKVLDGDRIILCPVRIFPVKGVEVAIRLLAAVNRYCAKSGGKACHLLVFGDPDEDLAYAKVIQKAIDEEKTDDKVVFLKGVPLGSAQNGVNVKLDERDLLSLCATSGGGVFFTPAVPDVESVGLGPALATLAGVPCAITHFNAFDHVYGNDFHVVKLKSNSREDLDDAALEFVHQMKDPQSSLSSSSSSNRMIQRNREILEERFPTPEWRKLMVRMASRAIEDKQTVLQMSYSMGLRNGKPHSSAITSISHWLWSIASYIARLPLINRVLEVLSVTRSRLGV